MPKQASLLGVNVPLSMNVLLGTELPVRVDIL